MKKRRGILLTGAGKETRKLVRNAQSEPPCCTHWVYLELEQGWFVCPLKSRGTDLIYLAERMVKLPSHSGSYHEGEKMSVKDCGSYQNGCILLQGLRWVIVHSHFIVLFSFRQQMWIFLKFLIKTRGYVSWETGPTIRVPCTEDLEAQLSSAPYRWPSEEKASSHGSLVEALAAFRLQKGWP